MRSTFVRRQQRLKQRSNRMTQRAPVVPQGGVEKTTRRQSLRQNIIELNGNNLTRRCRPPDKLPRERPTTRAHLSFFFAGPGVDREICKTSPCSVNGHLRRLNRFVRRHCRCDSTEPKARRDLAL
jgi:hypothetical protein